MNSEPVQCEFCKTDIPSEPCKLATYSATIEGKKYVFCCARCAKQGKREHSKKE